MPDITLDTAGYTGYTTLCLASMCHTVILFSSDINRGNKNIQMSETFTFQFHKYQIKFISFELNMLKGYDMKSRMYNLISKP